MALEEEKTATPVDNGHHQKSLLNYLVKACFWYIAQLRLLLFGGSFIRSYNVVYD